MELTAKRIKELERAEAKLLALEAGGVDNWDGYDFALEGYRAEEEAEERRDHLVDDILEALGSGAYEPSERGAGIAFAAEAEAAVMELIRKHDQHNQKD